MWHHLFHTVQRDKERKRDRHMHEQDSHVQKLKYLLLPIKRQSGVKTPMCRVMYYKTLTVYK